MALPAYLVDDGVLVSLGNGGQPDFNQFMMGKGGVDFIKYLLDGSPVADDDNGFEMVGQALELPDLPVGQCHGRILSSEPQLD